MVSTAPLKESSSVKEWMAQAVRLKRKMNDRSPLLSSNKMTHYFKEWKTPSGVLKKNILPYRNLALDKILSIVAAK